MKRIKWKDDCSFLKKGNQVALINGETYIKLNKEYFNIIEDIVYKKLDVSKLENYFIDKEDYKKIVEIIEKLKNIEVIVDNDYNQYNDESNIRFNSISLLITNRCNLSCLHCSENAEKSSCIKKELSFDEICVIVDSISKYKIDSITITGGEPLLRSDFFDIVKYIRLRYGGNLILMTNGTLISEKNVNELISLFDYISISLDGVDEELVSQIRCKGVYEKILKVVALLHDNNYYNIELSAILPSSIEVERKFEELCRKISVKPVIRSIIYSGRAYDNFSYIDDIFKRYINRYGYSSYDYVSTLSIGTLDVCDAGAGTLSINSVGDVFPCNLLQDDVYKIGNLLKDKNLLDYYLEGSILEKINQMKKLKIEPCYNCEVKFLCWFCLADYKELIKDNILFKNYCGKRKKAIYKNYFKE